MVKPFSVAFFDLDGTVYIEGSLLPEIKKELNLFQESGVEIYYLSNNTSVSRDSYHEKLKRLNIPVHRDCMITPVVPLSKWIKQNKIKTFFCVGTDDFVFELEKLSGAINDPYNPAIVIIANDTELSFAKLTKACEHINLNVPLYATHIDLNCPSKKGPMPDCGAIISLLETATKKICNGHFGKPSEYLVDTIKDILGDRRDFLVAGDRIYTDVNFGLKLGAVTLLVGTGEFDYKTDAKEIPKRAIYEHSLAEYLLKLRS